MSNAEPIPLESATERREHARVVKVLNTRGPIVQDDGDVECPVCGHVGNARYYMQHRQMAHVRTMPHAFRVQVDGMMACPMGCDATFTTSMQRQHLRQAHGLYANDTPPTPPASAVVTPRRDVLSTVSPTEAGLAVIAGLCPGRAVPVEQLGDVVEWLASTERLIESIREPNS